jgi:poly(3-hydroxyalkanoate) synthetase
MIADYHKGQSLVETLLANGIGHVALTDWKSATLDMKDLEIDNYLAEMVVAIDDLGGRVNLVGLCQGGWVSAMIAARFPDKVTKLVLAGAPIDTDAGNGPIKRMAHKSPMSAVIDAEADLAIASPDQRYIACRRILRPALSIAVPQYVGNTTRNYENAGERELRNRAAKTRTCPRSLVPNGCEKPADCGLFSAISLIFRERRDWVVGLLGYSSNREVRPRPCNRTPNAAISRERKLTSEAPRLNRS